jgi:hypothetical protein
MAKKSGALFPTRAKRPRRAGSSTFIQRSRNESSEQKAIFHQVTGAGRAHVIRQFVGLTSQEQDVAKTVLEGLIATRLATAQR